MWVYGITTLLDKNINTFAHTHLIMKIPNQMHYTLWVYPCCALHMFRLARNQGMSRHIPLSWNHVNIQFTHFVWLEFLGLCSGHIPPSWNSVNIQFTHYGCLWCKWPSHHLF